MVEPNHQSAPAVDFKTTGRAGPEPVPRSNLISRERKPPLDVIRALEKNITFGQHHLKIGCHGAGRWGHHRPRHEQNSHQHSLMPKIAHRPSSCLFYYRHLFHGSLPI